MAVSCSISNRCGFERRIPSRSARTCEVSIVAGSTSGAGGMRAGPFSKPLAAGGPAAPVYGGRWRHARGSLLESFPSASGTGAGRNRDGVSSLCCYDDFHRRLRQEGSSSWWTKASAVTSGGEVVPGRALGTMLTYGFPDLDLEAELALATRLGAKLLEILPEWSRFPDPRLVRQRAAAWG